ncbi:hypothetical protein ACU4GD_24310 [Cupriavidus basilensis]
MNIPALPRSRQAAPDPQCRRQRRDSRYLKGGRILQRAGFCRSTGRLRADQARAVADPFQHAPDLVLLDVDLHDINGLEVCRLIKNDPEIASTLVLQPSAALDRVAPPRAGARWRRRRLPDRAGASGGTGVEHQGPAALRKAEEAFRQSLQALRENEELFRQLAVNLSDALWILDPAESQFCT